MIHLVLASPLLIALCASFLQEIRKKGAIRIRQIVVACAAILASLNLALCLRARVPISTPVGSVNGFTRNPVIDFTNTHIKPGETIFVYPYSPIYYFLSGALNPTRFSYLLYRHQTRDQMLEVLDSLERDKTRYVIWDTQFETVAAPAFLPAYRPPSDRDRVIEPYLNEHYEQIALESGFRFMQRKSRR